MDRVHELGVDVARDIAQRPVLPLRHQSSIRLNRAATLTSATQPPQHQRDTNAKRLGMRTEIARAAWDASDASPPPQSAPCRKLRMPQVVAWSVMGSCVVILGVLGIPRDCKVPRTAALLVLLALIVWMCVWTLAPCRVNLTAKE